MSEKPLTKAYNNNTFLNSPDARTLRILAEYLEPQQRFRRQKIVDTIVFFGSARLKSLADAEEDRDQLLDLIRRKGKAPSKAQLGDLQTAEIMVRNAKYYDEAMELSRLLSKWSLGLAEKNRFVICSGGGPGIMEAANRGAQLAGAKSIGLNISLPFEQSSNPYIPPELNIEFHYFFMRKFWFIYPCKALVVFPGGFGTMDELFEVLTLVQTQKLRKDVFIVLYGRAFWESIFNFDGLLDARVISPDDLELFVTCDTPKEAFTHLRKKLSERYLK